METKIIEAVDRIAGNAHAGQVRKNSGIPYISHPRQVSNLAIDKISEYIETAEGKYEPYTLTVLASAALLHDVLEDCDVSRDDLMLSMKCVGIRNNMAFDILEIVTGLTDTAKQLYPMTNRAERKAIDGARISQHSKYVHMIKMCDIMCNVTDYVSEDPEYAIKYIDEKITYVKFLINLPKEFEDELYNFLNSKKLDAIINSSNKGIK